MTGERESAVACSMDARDVCETSTIMPTRLSSATTSRPNGDRPPHSSGRSPRMWIAESQISLVPLGVRVRYLAPSS